MIVIKVGGNELDNSAFLAGLADAVADLPEWPVIVHGGGRGTTTLIERLGLPTRFIEGQRVTDAETLELVVMGLVGQASMQLVQGLTRAGLPALGLSGADASLVTAEPLQAAGGALGAVGRPTAVNAERLHALRHAGFLPCIAPVCASQDGALFNVNADSVAQSVAVALGAELLLLLTNVPGVRLGDTLAHELTPEQVEAAIQQGEIHGGMIPKTRGAVASVRAGVRRALITDLARAPYHRTGQARRHQHRARPRPGPMTLFLKPSGGAVDAHETIRLDQQYLLQSYKRPPFVMERGEGVYLYDSEGQRYLDMVGGIAVNALGYADAGMLAVMQEQAARLLHTSNLYYTEPQARLAQKLVESCFADRVFFCNSGTEAVEGALKFARKWARTSSGDPEKSEIVSFSQAFHGRSMGALSTTANPAYREPFGPLLAGVSFAEFNDLASAAALIHARTAAVIVEPIQGEGGITPAREDFLRGLRALCDQHGAALIFDEIQCGMGRTGALWAYQATDVIPDLMTSAKPLGGGLPIGAILMTQRIADAIQVGDHGSTFAGGPFVTAVATHVFDRIANPTFLAHVCEVGTYLGEALSELAEAFPVIREVRGRGLMWGIELDPSLPAPSVVSAGYEQGLLLVGAGRNTVRLIPPLVLQIEHVDELVSKLRTLLTPA